MAASRSSVAATCRVLTVSALVAMGGAARAEPSPPPAQPAQPPPPPQPPQPPPAETKSEPNACASAYDDALLARRREHLRDARQLFARCAAPACADIVRRECVRAVRSIEDAQPTVGFRVLDADGNDVVDARIFVDEELLAASLTGKAIPVDPGLHRIRVERDGAEPVVLERVVIVEGEKGRVFKVDLPLRAPRPSDRDPRSSPVPFTPIVLGVAGAAAVVGTVSGILALSFASRVRDECPGRSCPPEHHDDLDATNRWSTISTVGFVVAGSAAAAGLFLLLSSSHAAGPKGSARAGCVPGLDWCWRGARVTSRRD